MVSPAQEGESTAEYRFDEDTAEVETPWAGTRSTGQGAVIAGRYRLARRLGAGSSAHVWTAHDERLDRDVAIKILRNGGAQGGAEQQRLRREAHVLAHLDHPRITAVFDLVDDADSPDGCGLALVTELLTGEDLAARLRRGPLDLDEALDLCAQVADALAAAHRAGVIHRDVKPANVMLTPAGVKLFDFGIARTDADSELTGASAIGTPACMAPEQWLGRHPRPETDVYALGCLLYWCLAGHAPFAERVLAALAVAHLESEPPALPDRGQNPRIDALYRACMAKDPNFRPTAETLAAELDPAARSNSTRRVAATERFAARWHRTSARSRATIVVTSGCLCVAGALAVPLSASSPAAQPTSSVAARSTSSASAAASSAGSKAKGGAVVAPSNGDGIASQAAAPPPGQASNSQPQPPIGRGKHSRTPPGQIGK